MGGRVLKAIAAEPSNQVQPDSSQVTDGASAEGLPAVSEDQAATVQPADATPLAAEAAAAPRNAQTSSGLIAVGLLIALVMTLGLVILMIRKRMLRDDSDDRSGAGLLDELREAVREGRMTQEEFDAAKRVMVAKMSAEYKAEKADRPKD